MTTETVLVTGGRYFNMTAEVDKVLSSIDRKRGIGELHHGGATGADELCMYWALMHSIPVFTHEADWKTFGPRAGVMRNAKMLRVAKPTIAVVFPGNAGTMDMDTRLAKAGVPRLKATESPDGSLSWRLI